MDNFSMMTCVYLYSYLIFWCLPFRILVLRIKFYWFWKKREKLEGFLRNLLSWLIVAFLSKPDFHVQFYPINTTKQVFFFTKRHNDTKDKTKWVDMWFSGKGTKKIFAISLQLIPEFCEILFGNSAITGTRPQILQSNCVRATYFNYIDGNWWYRIVQMLCI